VCVRACVCALCQPLLAEVVRVCYAWHVQQTFTPGAACMHTTCSAIAKLSAIVKLLSSCWFMRWLSQSLCEVLVVANCARTCWVHPGGGGGVRWPAPARLSSVGVAPSLAARRGQHREAMRAQTRTLMRSTGLGRNGWLRAFIASQLLGLCLLSPLEARALVSCSSAQPLVARATRASIGAVCLRVGTGLKGRSAIAHVPRRVSRMQRGLFSWHCACAPLAHSPLCCVARCEALVARVPRVVSRLCLAKHKVQTPPPPFGALFLPAH
jgi:hypothetical protein